MAPGRRDPPVPPAVSGWRRRVRRSGPAPRRPWRAAHPRPWRPPAPASAVSPRLGSSRALPASAPFRSGWGRHPSGCLAPRRPGLLAHGCAPPARCDDLVLVRRRPSRAAGPGPAPCWGAARKAVVTGDVHDHHVAALRHRGLGGARRRHRHRPGLPRPTRPKGLHPEANTGSARVPSGATRIPVVEHNLHVFRVDHDRRLWDEWRAVRVCRWSRWLLAIEQLHGQVHAGLRL